MPSRVVTRLCFFSLLGLITTASAPADAKNPRALQLVSNPQGGPVGELLPLNDGVLIDGHNGTKSAILHRSDGTVAGTRAFAILPAVDNYLGGTALLVTIGGTAFFQDRTNAIWKTSGTVETTKHAVPSAPDASGRATALANGSFVYDVVGGTGATPPLDLVRSDGTAQGTSKIAGATRRSSARTVVDGNDVYFIAENGAIKRTDGTTVTDVAATPFTTSSIAKCGGVLYAGTGASLVRIDGTVISTLVEVPANGLVCAGSRVVFRGYTAQAGNEPWASDGTVAGTGMLADIAPGSTSSLDSTFVYNGRSFGSRVFFPAKDGAGSEPWVTDGTTAGTVRVGDLTPGPDGSIPAPLGVVGTTLYFLAGTAGRSLYALAAGSTTAQLVTSSLVSEPSTLDPVVSGGKLFAEAGNHRYLWVFDPSEPIDPGDGQPDVVPYVSPPMATPGSDADAGTSSSSSSSSSGATSSSSGGGASSSSGSGGGDVSEGPGAATPEGPSSSADSGGCAAAPSGAGSALGGFAMVGAVFAVQALLRRRRSHGDDDPRT